MRKLMIHGYVRDIAVLAAALTRGQLHVTQFEDSTQRLADQVLSALGPAGSADGA